MEGSLRPNKPFASCSTPEGIDAAITRRRIVNGRAEPRAQRPKASMRRSLSKCDECDGTGFCAQRPKASMRRSPLLRRRRSCARVVLNARRHRCGDHCPASCAGNRRPLGAQRPKASMRRSLTIAGQAIGLLYAVLNARRHRCGDHDERLQRVLFVIRVLNARRHRCGDHDVAAVISDKSDPCSTPEGIDAAITKKTSHASGFEVVLNARRHRCGDHPTH